MNSQITASIKTEPSLGNTFVDIEAFERIFGTDFRVNSSTDPHQSNAYRDASQLSPILLIISAALGLAASLGAKKVIELFAEDMYKSAKNIVKALFKDEPQLYREVRLELLGIEPLIYASVSSADPQVVERALSEDLITLTNQATEILEQANSPSVLTYFNPDIAEEELLKAGDPLPENVQWVLLQYEPNTRTWLIKSLVTQDNKIYLNE